MVILATVLNHSVRYQAITNINKAAVFFRGDDDNMSKEDCIASESRSFNNIKPYDFEEELQ